MIAARGKHAMENLSEYIRRALDEQGISIRQACERATEKGYKISLMFVTALLQGEANNPTIKSIIALAAALNKPVGEVARVCAISHLSAEDREAIKPLLLETGDKVM